jgi:hypothetical protein
MIIRALDAVVIVMELANRRNDRNKWMSQAMQCRPPSAAAFN